MSILYLLLAGLAIAQGAQLPHLVFNLIDDWGWANVGYHRVAGWNETLTPNIDALVSSGINLNSYYVHKYCSPSRSSYQSGRLPFHVNVVNADMSVANPNDPVSGFAGVPRNMTGLASKLKSVGYNTDTPLGRGYDASIIYFHHANDYWDQTDDTLCKVSPKKNNDFLPIVDLWATGGPANKLNNSWSCSQTNQAPGCKYEDEIFVEAVLDFIAAHDPTTPMYLFWAPHIVHAPLEVPQAYLDNFAFIDTKPRRFYAAMVNFVDDLVGRVVAALKAKGMWDNLLWVSSADNGGPIYNSGAAGANNWPKRGGKMSNWQGGINVNAYASGGLLPPAVRGTTNNGLMAGCDIYSTYCAMAGVDPEDERAAAAGLPPIDGLNVWPWLSGANGTSPRTEIPVGSDATEANLLQLGNATVVQGLVRADGWKLLIGETGQDIWTGPQYPNASTNWPDNPHHCGVPSDPVVGKGGCLFNVLTDPNEHDDVAAQHPDIVKEMYARILELQATAFSPNRGVVQPAACDKALNTYKGFWGPFIE